MGLLMTAPTHPQRRPAIEFVGTLLALGLGLLPSSAKGQSVEFLVGASRATQDVMFFKFVPQPTEQLEEETLSDVLFFFRARSSVGYEGSPQAPQFGLTAALSYNPAALRGFAPVLVGQTLSHKMVAKAGIQFARVRPRLTVFLWTVSELASLPSLDAFLLARYTHPLTTRLGLFLQAEALGVLPTHGDVPLSITERFRLGLQLHRFQMGAAIDLSQTGRTEFTQTVNPGAFIRHDF